MIDVDTIAELRAAEGVVPKALIVPAEDVHLLPWASYGGLEKSLWSPAQGRPLPIIECDMPCGSLCRVVWSDGSVTDG